MLHTKRKVPFRALLPSFLTLKRELKGVSTVNCCTNLSCIISDFEIAISRSERIHRISADVASWQHPLNRNLCFWERCTNLNSYSLSPCPASGNQIIVAKQHIFILSCLQRKLVYRIERKISMISNKIRFRNCKLRSLFQTGQVYVCGLCASV